MVRESHSDKALKTIELMNTQPHQWGKVPIKWVLEKRMVSVLVDCKNCTRGQIRVEKDGTQAVNTISYKDDYYKWNERQSEIRTLSKAQCPACPPSRKWHGSGTGQVREMQLKDVWVGYPQFDKDTRFDSRFEESKHYTARLSKKAIWHVCALCSKSISDPGGIIPVHGKGEDGVIHGMWVGLDCGRKFLGVKDYKREDAKRGDQHMIESPLTKGSK